MTGRCLPECRAAGKVSAARHAGEQLGPSDVMAIPRSQRQPHALLDIPLHRCFAGHLLLHGRLSTLLHTRLCSSHHTVCTCSHSLPCSPPFKPSSHQRPRVGYCDKLTYLSKVIQVTILVVSSRIADEVRMKLEPQRLAASVASKVCHTVIVPARRRARAAPCCC